MLIPRPAKSARAELLSFGLSTLSSIVVLLFSFMLAKRLMSPAVSKKQRKNIEGLLKKLNRKPASPLTEYEEMVAMQLVDPESIEVTFGDIGGQEKLIKEIVKVTSLPIERPELFAKSALLTPSKGILLYGPPGTGKTMLARAVAKESGYVFINLNFAHVLNKFVGETEKLISAVFSLATKLSPSLIFIDEIDCYFRRRSMSDHEFTGQMKAQFMSLWDGFEKSNRVIVMAASNRPDTIDAAILRRLPCKFEVGLPTQQQREAILRVILRDEHVSSDVDLPTVASATQGFSGDELKEMCKAAALMSLKLDSPPPKRRGVVNDNDTDAEDGIPVGNVALGEITMANLNAARKTIVPSALFAVAED